MGKVLKFIKNHIIDLSLAFGSAILTALFHWVGIFDFLELKKSRNKYSWAQKIFIFFQFCLYSSQSIFEVFQYPSIQNYYQSNK